jgi:hypothetical protein
VWWKKPAREVSGGVLHLNLKIVMWVNVEGLKVYVCLLMVGYNIVVMVYCNFL